MTIHEIKPVKDQSKDKFNELLIERLEMFIKRIKEDGDLEDLAIIYTHKEEGELRAGTDIVFGDNGGATLNTAVDVTKMHVLDYFMYGMTTEDDDE